MIQTLILFIHLMISSFYSLSFQDSNGTTVPMSNFSGKKILLVNIATGSSRAGQLAGLQQLQGQYGDSLVIIAFPSASFGAETRNDAEIKAFCQANYYTTFTIAAKGNVAGSNLQPVYNWLAQTTENGDMDLVIGGDFQKILIGKDGHIMGIFSPKLQPTDSLIINAITSNN
jgi:glutathione peroxidase